MINRKTYCSNCGKNGHYAKICPEPSISTGILIIKLEDDIKNILTDTNEIKNRYEEINNFNYERLCNLNKLELYKDKIKFLLIERKHSLNYIEFIRGLYDPYDLTKLNKMFKLMSKQEISNIKTKNFDKLWNDLWLKTAKKKIYKKEYTSSNNKFNIIKNNGSLNSLLLSGTFYDSPEWEIPKGRRNNFETNLECATRELFEETSLEESDYILLNNFFSLHDEFIGTNGNNYKHIYYIGVLNSEKNLDLINNSEVNKAKFVNIEDAVHLIRNYYESKIHILNKVFLFFLNLCEDNINDKVKNLII